MSCSNTLCNNLVISTAVNYDQGTNTVIVNLPQGNYENRSNYCIVIAQAIPSSATITAPVVFSIGGAQTQYPFLNCDCTPVYAYQIATRTRYSTRVFTDVSSGVFKSIGRLQCSTCACRNNAIPSLPATTA